MQAPSFKNKGVQALFEAVQSRDPDQPEFLQAVEEVLQTMEPVFEKHPECASATHSSMEHCLPESWLADSAGQPAE